MTTAAQAPLSEQSGGDASPRALRLFGITQLLLAAILLLNSLAGPLAFRVIAYPITTSMGHQLIGLELVTVFLVVPWAAGVAVMALRGNPTAPLLGFAPAAYTAYMFAQYVLGPEYTHYSITVLAHLGIFVLATALTLGSWSLARQAPLPPMTSTQRRRSAVVLLALVIFVTSRYAEAIFGAFTDERMGIEQLSEPTFFWSIFLLDLGIVVPATTLAGLALIRGTAQGARGLYAVVGWFALVPPSVAAMALVMWANDDPDASLPTVVVLGLAALLFGAFAWRTLRPLVLQGTAPPRH